MELMKENIDTNAEIIARLNQELMDVNRQVEEQCQKRGKLESDIASIKAKSAVESKNSKLIEELNVKRSEARGLKEGVELLSGVADPTASRLENGDLRMSFKIEGFVFDITTDKTTKCVTDIRNVSGDFQHDLTKVLQSCAAIPAQQDLRFAIHSIKSMIHSAIILKKHIADLRKFCIVKQSNDTGIVFLNYFRHSVVYSKFYL